jgi:hypothetical protein
MIELNKQSKKILKMNGDRVIKIKWNSFKRLRNFDKILTGEINTSYFLSSNFPIFDS